MVLRLNNNLTIENPGHFSPETVERLRTMLVRGSQAQADPRRENFFEIENGDHVCWIHVSPITGHVVLLAVWDKPEVTIAATQVRAA